MALVKLCVLLSYRPLLACKIYLYLVAKKSRGSLTLWTSCKSESLMEPENSFSMACSIECPVMFSYSWKIFLNWGRFLWHKTYTNSELMFVFMIWIGKKSPYWILIHQFRQITVPQLVKGLVRLFLPLLHPLHQTHLDDPVYKRHEGIYLTNLLL